MIYFDNAATTGKKPQAVLNAVTTAMQKLSANPGRSGHEMAQKAGETVYKTREKVAKMFGTEPTNVVFTQNCTQSLNFVIKGVLKPGDHVIISSLEHNAVARPVYKMLGDGLIELDVAQVILGDSEATVRSFRRLIKKNTKMIICTHASNVTGEILPIKEIALLCKENGIIFTVDAAQTAGVMPIDMGNMGIDYLCIAPHKGLYSPMGIGILCAHRPIESTIIEGGTGSHSNMLAQPLDMPERFESGTVNLPGIAGVSAGIDFVNNFGLEKIYSHELMLYKTIFEGISKIPGVSVYSGMPQKGKTAPVFSFNIDGITSMEVASMLSKKGIASRAGLHCAPLAHLTLGTIDTGTVRVSPSVFNNKNEVYALINAVKSIKNN